MKTNKQPVETMKNQCLVGEGMNRWNTETFGSENTLYDAIMMGTCIQISRM